MQLDKVVPGQPVILTSDLYGGGVKFHGQVKWPGRRHRLGLLADPSPERLGQRPGSRWSSACPSASPWIPPNWPSTRCAWGLSMKAKTDVAK
ncbi:hypothetical protein ACRAWD_20190 [Caulobacter segnis]